MGVEMNEAEVLTNAKLRRSRLQHLCLSAQDTCAVLVCFGFWKPLDGFGALHRAFMRKMMLSKPGARFAGDGLAFAEGHCIAISDYFVQVDDALLVAVFHSDDQSFCFIFGP